MLRRIVTLISMGFVAVMATEKSEKLDNIQKSLDNILAKAGIQFNGEFRSEYLPSKITGDSTLVKDTNRQVESNEFTSVDFDITARPNSMLSARAIFRFHQNWQNFFSDVANPIFSRWISIDGNVNDMFSFHVGDLKEKYSPLTLFAPEIEILNEPYIFARQRTIAMNELFLGNNNRILQGLTFRLDAELVPLFDELHLGLIATRLRNIETYTQNGSKVTSDIQKMQKNEGLAKYVVGGNLDLVFFKGVNFGFTDLFIFDQKASFKGASRITGDTLTQRTNVLSVRPGVDVAKLLSSDALNLGLKTEFAMSADDSAYATTTKEIKHKNIPGSAMDITAKVGYTAEEVFGINANLSFISNSKDFRNEMAQNPTYYGDRIYNRENNVNNDLLYNTFDGLYHSIFKFTPSLSTNRYDKNPIMVTSYGRSIFTKKELLALVAADDFDPALQLVMPFGPATPNRSGIKADLEAKFINDGIKVNALFASLSEATAIKHYDTVATKATFSQFGAGVNVDISRMASVLKYPLQLSGSYVMSGEKIPEAQKLEIASGFMNLGLYYKFWKRTAVMAGYQFIQNDYKSDSTLTQTFSNWSAGLEWQVADGADVVVAFGQMGSKLPKKLGEFTQTQADVSLRVKF